MVWDFRPMPFEDAAAEFVDFTLEGNVEAGSFQANVETANAREERGCFVAMRGGIAIAARF